MERVLDIDLAFPEVAQGLELERRQRANVAVAVGGLRGRHLRDDIVDALPESGVAGRCVFLRQGSEVVAERVSRDAGRLPSAVQLALRFEARVLARVVQQPIGFEFQQVARIAFARFAERSVQQHDAAIVELAELGAGGGRQREAQSGEQQLAAI